MFLSIFTFEAFSFPHCEQASLHTYDSCPQHALLFPRLSSKAGSVCVFVFSLMTRFIESKCFSLAFILDMEHQDALPLYSVL